MILDTSALSAFIDGEPGVGARLSAQAQATIPVVVLGEFRFGISDSRHHARYERWLDEHLPDFEILPVTAATAIVYARLRGALKRLGRPIPANDAWIAALALEHQQPILSRDEHFDAVAGLRRETW